MKFFKKHRLKLVIVVIILAGIWAVLYIKQQKFYDNNPGLIPPKTNYDVEFNLTEDEATPFEENVKKYDDLIKNFVPSTWEQEIDLGNGIKWTATTISQPKAEWFLGKAKNLQYLGRYTEAIQTYNELFKLYETNTDWLIDLWELYKRIKEWNLALLQYKKLVEVDPKTYMSYYKEIIKIYLNLNDPEQAGQRYIKYELAWWERNEVLMNDIKSMKEQQK